MPVFKKLKKSKEALDAELPAVKQLDFKIGLDCYRDFYTLKNYWKTINRKQKYASNVLFYRGISKNDKTLLQNQESNNSKVIDSRLPFLQFRELYTLKNYFKTVRRNEDKCAKQMFYKYIKANEENKMRYDKLKNIQIFSEDCGETAFESIALAYLKVFDDVINFVEDSPSDATSACRRLSLLGKMHRTKVPGMKFDDFQQLEEPFLYMIEIILQDRYNEKAENLFRKFFQFCLKYILEGFNS